MRTPSRAESGRAEPGPLEARGQVGERFGALAGVLDLAGYGASEASRFLSRTSCWVGRLLRSRGAIEGSGVAGINAQEGALYRLTGDDLDDDWGYACDAVGLFVPLDGGRRDVDLLGCEPQGVLKTAAHRIGSKRALAGNAYLAFLDGSGKDLGVYFVNQVTVERSKPSGRGGRLVDLTVSLYCDDLSPQTEWPWQLIRTGGLNRNGMWHGLDAAGRHAWLSVALKRSGPRFTEDRLAGGVYELDGSHVTDADGFYCALGEAVNGPGGYFGWNLNAVDDCLGGGWGAEAPFTLIWNHSAPSLFALRTATTQGDDGWVDVLMEVFHDHGVKVQFR